MTKAEFLVLDYKERATTGFRRKFAEFLADGARCHQKLVRECFDAEENSYMAKQKKRLLPARFQQLLAVAAKEQDPARRARMFQDCDRVRSASEKAAFPKEMRRLLEEFRAQHHAKLIGELTRLHPFDQILYLNRHLREHGLLRPEAEINPAQERSAKKSGYTTVAPRKIYHEDVEEDFYRNDPRHLKHEQAERELLAEELGDTLAAKFTKGRGIPNDGFYLSQVGSAIRVLRQRANKSFEQTCRQQNFLVRALKKAFLVDPKSLREFIAWAVRLHLGIISARKQRGSEQLAKIFRWKIRRLRCNYWRIYCLSFGNAEIIEAVANFFFHGLSPDELRSRPGLIAKLPLKPDTKLLCDFLFNTATDRGKNTKGLIAHWIDCDAAGSVHRREWAWANHPKAVARMKAEGKIDFEIVERVESLAGVDSIQKQTDTAYAKYQSPSSHAALERTSIEEDIRQNRVESAKKLQNRLFERAQPSRRTKPA